MAIVAFRLVWQYFAEDFAEKLQLQEQKESQMNNHNQQVATAIKHLQHEVSELKKSKVGQL